MQRAFPVYKPCWLYSNQLETYNGRCSRCTFSTSASSATLQWPGQRFFLQYLTNKAVDSRLSHRLACQVFVVTPAGLRLLLGNICVYCLKTGLIVIWKQSVYYFKTKCLLLGTKYRGGQKSHNAIPKCARASSLHSSLCWTSLAGECYVVGQWCCRW